MNFNIIENPDPGYNIEEVIKDYMNMDIPVKDIKEKYGITKGRWQTLLKHFKDEGIPMRTNNRLNTPPKYYTKDKRYNRWYVQRTIRGHQYGFGAYATEEEAQARVQELHENNWNGLL